MAKHIGIVASSAEGASLCYRAICLEAASVMGEHNHPEITMNSVPLAEHMSLVRADNGKALAEALTASARKVAQAGADFVICPDNTVHQRVPVSRSVVSGECLRSQVNFREYLARRAADPAYTFRQHLRDTKAAIEE